MIKNDEISLLTIYFSILQYKSEKIFALHLRVMQQILLQILNINNF